MTWAVVNQDVVVNNDPAMTVTDVSKNRFNDEVPPTIEFGRALVNLF